MQKAVTIFNQLKEVSKQGDKIDLLAQGENVPFFKEMLQFLLSKDITTGLNLKKIRKEIPASVEKELDKDDVLTAMEYIRLHNTGKDANVKTIQNWIKLQPKETRSFYEEFFTKTFKSGVGIKLANKFFGNSFINDFSVQLANSFNKLEANDKVNYNKEYIVTQKLDGIRCLTKLGSTITNFSRQGKEIDYLAALKKELVRFKEMINGNFVLDGELLAVNDKGMNSDDLFRYTQGLISNKENKFNIEYHIFDTLPLEDFEADNSTETYLERRVKLDQMDKLIKEEEFEFLKIVPVLDRIKADKVHNWLDWAEENNFEGVMLNDVDGLYERKRTNGLLKVKRYQTADLQIVGFEMAESGQFKGTLKSVIVRLGDDNFCNVGSGLSIEERDIIRDNQEKYLGKMTEIKYFEVSKDKTGKESLRFPIWTGIIREDKSVKDTNLY